MDSFLRILVDYMNQTAKPPPGSPGSAQPPAALRTNPRANSPFQNADAPGPAVQGTTPQNDTFWQARRGEDRPVESSAVQPDDLLMGAGLVKGGVEFAGRKAADAFARHAAEVAASAAAKRGGKTAGAALGSEMGHMSAEELLAHFGHGPREAQSILGAEARNAALKGKDAAARSAKVKDAVSSARAELTPTPQVGKRVSREAATNPGIKARGGDTAKPAPGEAPRADGKSGKDVIADQLAQIAQWLADHAKAK